MDYTRFFAIVRRQWVRLANERDGLFPFTMNDCVSVFRYFFEAFKHFRGEDHPLINTEQVKTIIEEMPYVTNEHFEEIIDIPVCFYPPMIDRYFKTKYENCDYRINHFFSGRIRELKFYECMREAE